MAWRSDSWNAREASGLVATRAADGFAKRIDRLVGQLETLDQRDETASETHDRAQPRTYGPESDVQHLILVTAGKRCIVITCRLGRSLLETRTFLRTVMDTVGGD